MQGTLSAGQLQALIDHGNKLFVAKFTSLDRCRPSHGNPGHHSHQAKAASAAVFSAAPGTDSNACSSCHNDPVTGGAGDVVTNVFVSEGFTNADFDTSDPQFSNERNTNHLMGAGLVELLAREMTADLHGQRSEALRSARQTGKPVTARLVTKGVDFGEITAAPDGIVELSAIEGSTPISSSGRSARRGNRLAAAVHGQCAEPPPHGIQATERFGERWDRRGRLLTKTALPMK